jgi:hypothetical protein
MTASDMYKATKGWTYMLCNVIHAHESYEFEEGITVIAAFKLDAICIKEYP